MPVAVAGILVIAVVLAAVFLAVTAYARRNPVEMFVRMTRRRLVQLGLRRRQLVRDGQKVVYWRGGEGTRDLLLVHGVNDQAGTWVSVLPALLPRFRVTIVDLPGHGESDPKSGPLPMGDSVAALAAVMDAETSGPVVLVGNSMGGWVSSLYATDHPERVGHLILEDGSGMAWDLSHANLAPVNRDQARGVMRMVHGPDAPLPDYLLDAMIRHAPKQPTHRVVAAGVLEWLLDARLPKLTMPVTLIWGAHDGLLPLAYAETLKSRIPGATLQVIGSAAHIPHRQAPAEFARLLLEAVTVDEPEAVQA
jgi:pyruvate dehydrogenase E2 component (dihydrolipoamide acetyltransferase)